MTHRPGGLGPPAFSFHPPPPRDEHQHTMHTTPQTRRGRRRSAKTPRMIDGMVRIAAESQPCGGRSLAYQMFNRKLIPSMECRNTKKVSVWPTTAREEGTLPWAGIVDPTRQEQVVPTWDDPEAYGRA